MLVSCLRPSLQQLSRLDSFVLPLKIMAFLLSQSRLLVGVVLSQQDHHPALGESIRQLGVEISNLSL